MKLNKLITMSLAAGLILGLASCGKNNKEKDPTNAPTTTIVTPTTAPTVKPTVTPTTVKPTAVPTTVKPTVVPTTTPVVHVHDFNDVGLCKDLNCDATIHEFYEFSNETKDSLTVPVVDGYAYVKMSKVCAWFHAHIAIEMEGVEFTQFSVCDDSKNDITSSFVINDSSTDHLYNHPAIFDTNIYFKLAFPEHSSVVLSHAPSYFQTDHMYPIFALIKKAGDVYAKECVVCRNKVDLENPIEFMGDLQDKKGTFTFEDVGDHGKVLAYKVNNTSECQLSYEAPMGLAAGFCNLDLIGDSYANVLSLGFTDTYLLIDASVTGSINYEILDVPTVPADASVTLFGYDTSYVKVKKPEGNVYFDDNTIAYGFYDMKNMGNIWGSSENIESEYMIIGIHKHDDSVRSVTLNLVDHEHEIDHGYCTKCGEEYSIIFDVPDDDMTTLPKGTTEGYICANSAIEDVVCHLETTKNAKITVYDYNGDVCATGNNKISFIAEAGYDYSYEVENTEYANQLLIHFE